MILNPPTDRIFQSATAVMILDVYATSVSVVQLPLHSCWGNSRYMHLGNIDNNLSSAFEYVF